MRWTAGLSFPCASSPVVWQLSDCQQSHSRCKLMTKALLCRCCQFGGRWMQCGRVSGVPDLNLLSVHDDGGRPLDNARCRNCNCNISVSGKAGLVHFHSPATQDRILSKNCYIVTLSFAFALLGHLPSLLLHTALLDLGISYHNALPTLFPA